jgi:hypothetical protein
MQRRRSRWSLRRQLVNEPMRSAHGDVAALFGLIILASVIAVHAWNTTPRHWSDPDSLFYRAAVLRIEGTSKAAALAEAVHSDIARTQREYDSSKAPADRRITNPAWLDYSSRFYERRWLVPLVGAALDPLFGANGLIVASLIAYVLLGPFLFLLLRLRFRWQIAAAVTGIVLVLPLIRLWSTRPMTDMWGLTLECLALAAGLIALERGRRWIALWSLVVLTLSFTRDTTLVVIAGALAAFLFRRDRRSAAVLVTGLAAALPAPLIFGSSLREAAAYTVNDFYPPPNPSWSFVFSHLPVAIRSLVHQDLAYLQTHLVNTIAIVGGFAALLAYRRVLQTGTAFVFGAAAGSLVSLLLLPNYSEFRLELVVVPFSALGLAAAAAVAEEHRPLFRARSRPARGAASEARSRRRLHLARGRDRLPSLPLRWSRSDSRV